MERPASLIGACVHRAYLCEEWELRVTERCVADDDLTESGPSFEELLGDDVVSQFRKKMSDTPYTTRDVNKLSSGMKAWIVQAGGRRRGCAWHDEENEVIWLLASHPHESGADDDSWPYFRDLDSEGRLFPSENDLHYLREENNARFFDALIFESERLIAEARANDGVEQRASLVDRYGTGLQVSVVETIEERVLAVSSEGFKEGDYRRMPVILAAFGFEKIPDQAERIGGREIDPETELGFKMDIEH